MHSWLTVRKAGGSEGWRLDVLPVTSGTRNAQRMRSLGIAIYGIVPAGAQLLGELCLGNWCETVFGAGA